MVRAPLPNAPPNAGWNSKRIPAIWTSENGQTMQPNYNLANAYEMFFYARSCDGILSLPGRLNLFDFPVVLFSQSLPPHPSRPIELMREIIKTFSFGITLKSSSRSRVLALLFSPLLWKTAALSGTT